jgi:glyoxylase-like metal-dependent hydrolase (beta-lactamase superfamily II)
VIAGHVHRIARRQFLAESAAAALAASACVSSLRPTRAAVHTVPVHKSGSLETLVVSDGHFFLPAGFLVTPDSPPAEREAALNAAGQTGEQLQLVNTVAVIRSQSDVVLVDTGTGPRHQPTAGKLAENLEAAGIPPAAVTKIVLTHGHPDHLWGILDANDKPIYPNASYFVSTVEWNLWVDPDVMRRLPAVLATNDRIINGAKNHFSHVKDKIRTVRDGDEIVSGVQVIDTPGHTQGHISVEIAGGDGLVVVADALTHAVISFQHPSWPVPVDHEPDRGISTRLRLLDRLVIDKRRLIGAHLPFPGTGFVERKDGAYRFVPT